MKRNYGFSLIEMAIVVAIGATLLTLGLAALNSQSNSAGYSITKKRQDLIKDALIAHLGANKRFPCPYVPTTGSAATGIAPAQSGAPPACPQSFGTIPFATLGLAREIGEDGWGNLFSYQIYAATAPVCPGVGRDWGNSACFGAGKIDGPMLTIIDGTPVPPANFVAVIISHGANGLGAWVAAQGTRNANPVSSCDEAHNARIATVPGCALATNTYYKGESQANDDVVAYLTASDAIQPLVKQGAINSAIAQANIDLQTLYDQAIANNASSLDCTNPPSSLGTLIDPWGNAYANIPPPPVSANLFCLHSTGGTGSAPANTCICSSPAICRSVEKTLVSNYRNRASATPIACP